MTEEINGIRLDHPLRVGNATAEDSLNRSSFANSITGVLKRVSGRAGLVVSVEGSWGSGKTSLLAMIEEALDSENASEKAVVVHFNPWLIGERDALLGQFLGSIASKLELADHAGDGKRVAEKLETYSKAFDLLKFIPGAEPWASMVKSVVESVGDAAGSIAESKTPDIEARKKALEKALIEHPRRIIVLIDDLDRLFPAEVFEMVRIVKAVGDLPNIGYVLAWDSSYVSEALEKLNVPFARSYLDKVVQIRLPIPPLSFTMRAELMNKVLDGLPREALKEYFPKSDERLSLLFYHGLSDLIETPRDIVRLADVIKTIEPGLRGEINLADIIGLASLMTMAPSVFQLLHRVPQAFVGRQPGARSVFEKPEDVIKNCEIDRNQAYSECYQQKAVRKVVSWLFPLVPEHQDGHTHDGAVFIEGHVAHPRRLLVALQLSMRRDDISLVRVQQFVMHPAKRDEILHELRKENCVDFLRSLRDLTSDRDSDVELDVMDLAIAIARMVDSAAFTRGARNRNSVFEPRSDTLALKTIEDLVSRESDAGVQKLSEKLISDPIALSVAALVALRSFNHSNSDNDSRIKAVAENQSSALSRFAENIENALRDGSFFEKCNPHIILYAAAKLIPTHCATLFLAAMEHDPTCDQFVEAHLQGTLDSTNGQRYALPDDISRLEVFVPLQKLKELATARLEDEGLLYPFRAAWRAIKEERQIYGKDGSIPENWIS